MQESKEYYSVPELAKMLSVRPETIRREIARGHIRASKVGSDYRMSKDEIRRYLNSVPTK